MAQIDLSFKGTEKPMAFLKLTSFFTGRVGTNIGAVACVDVSTAEEFRYRFDVPQVAASLLRSSPWLFRKDALADCEGFLDELRASDLRFKLVED
jgi:hypothetical protein